MEIAVSDGRVHFPESWGGKLGRVPVNGGEAMQLAVGHDRPFGIAIASSGLYVAEAGAGIIKKLTIKR